MQITIDLFVSDGVRPTYDTNYNGFCLPPSDESQIAQMTIDFLCLIHSSHKLQWICCPRTPTHKSHKLQFVVPGPRLTNHPKLQWICCPRHTHHTNYNGFVVPDAQLIHIAMDLLSPAHNSSHTSHKLQWICSPTPPIMKITLDLLSPNHT